DVRRRNCARFVETQLASVDHQQALGVAAGRSAVARSEPPPALERPWNGGGGGEGLRLRRGVGRRPAHRIRRRLVHRRKLPGGGVGVLGDRLAPAAGGDRQDDGKGEEGQASSAHALLTLLPTVVSLV